nr:MAG TPA: hypothetical protein [Caudoviricetes sp.]
MPPLSKKSLLFSLPFASFQSNIFARFARIFYRIKYSK